ncbi:MAG: threonine/serine dehydratase [Flavobacteriaceae bacterium]|nr:threonine/serine dehydratase [Flavobacteriaceae bacterium]
MNFTQQNISDVRNDISKYVIRTPVLRFDFIDSLCGCNVFFKCENFQHTGSFKYRAAINAIKNIPPQFKNRGVITHSSGNFAHSLSKASKELNIPCHIVMPSNTPKFKKSAVQYYTKDIIECEPNLKSRELTTSKILNEKKLYFIHPSNNMDVILGNSTCALELIEDYQNLDYVFSPIGGGGLIAGTSIAIKNFTNNCKIIGAEPSNVDDAYRSLISGKIETNSTTVTVADGLRTNLGTINFPIIQQHVKEILLVSEKEIIESLNIILNNLKLVVEPSSSVVLAALIKNKSKFKNKNIGLIMCGGNIDFDNLKF